MELGVLILLGTLLTSNTGFALVVPDRTCRMKLLNQLLREKQERNRGEKEPLQPVASLPLGPDSPGSQGTPIPG
ncbi:hypothetical protein GDO86_014578 [Hymenochirus boettgeri]|uniref:Uncharacterized protein n=1 Tax=Hymenochirus boettgeri TaxID=247094 RepID=A0A8T2JXT2_9PIPI|nr:hypothetical protein GDO86_014578 [Hymenochirus boettgeri]